MHCRSYIFLLILDSKWLGKESGYIFYPNDEINMNCSLKDSTKIVTLWKSETLKYNYRQIVPDGRRILQFNQIFRILNLTLSDEGDYQCRAENMASLKVMTVHLSNSK
jgi:hypothetical protein